MSCEEKDLNKMEDYEQLLESQREENNELTRLIGNYRRDGPARKTFRYLNDKVLTFNSAFRTIEQNHELLVKYRPKDTQQDYFDSDIYGNIRALFDLTMALLNRQLEWLKKNPNHVHLPGDTKSFPELFKLKINEQYANDQDGSTEPQKAGTSAEEPTNGSNTEQPKPSKQGNAVSPMNVLPISTIATTASITANDAISPMNVLPISTIATTASITANDAVMTLFGPTTSTTSLTNTIPTTRESAHAIAQITGSQRDGSLINFQTTPRRMRNVNFNTKIDELMNENDTSFSIFNETIDEFYPNNREEVNIALMAYHNELKNLLTAGEQLNESSPFGTILITIKNIERVWAELRLLYYQEIAAKKPIPFDYNRLTVRYTSATGNLEELANNIRTFNSRNANIQSLPKLKLPEFDGKISEWKHFINLYDKMVHLNPSIEKDYKIEYLRSSIKGEALKIISKVLPNKDNYDSCYNLLRNRYDNKREIIGEALDTIIFFDKIKSVSAYQLKNLHDTVYESMMAIANLGIDIKSWDPFLTHIIIKKLDSASHMTYECQLTNVKEPQKLDELLKFIESRFLALESAGTRNENYVQQRRSQYSDRNNHVDRIRNETNQKNNDNNVRCFFCEKASHSRLHQCDVFKSKKTFERLNIIKENKLCFNCFGQHRSAECTSKHVCKECNKKHHTLLHSDNKQVKTNVAQSSLEEKIEKEVRTNVCSSTTGLLATALVAAFDVNGARIMLRALLDQGSTGVLISESATQLLKLKIKNVSALVTGIGNKAQKSSRYVHVTVGPRFQSDFVLHLEAVVLPKLVSVSGCDTTSNDFDFVENLCLADPKFTQGSDIDIVLGCAEYAQLIKEGLIKSLSNQIAQNTELGWVVSGAVQVGSSSNIVSLVSNIDLQKTMKKYFSMDEFKNDDNDVALTEEEIYCESHYNRTVKRNKDGRFIVTIPLKNGLSYPELGDSRRVAVAMQFQLEKRFERNAKLGEEYSKFIREGIALGHIEEVPINESKNDKAHFLPHHCVFKDSTTTKLRVVYNASQKTSNGKCLNDFLAIGSVNQSDILTLLLHFRIFKYAFTADVEKMYKQILLAKHQWDLHRFVYRFSKDEPLKEYRLKTVTFGTGNAPYLAIRTIEELAKSVEHMYPIAARIILSCMYMDDVISGCHTLEELPIIYEQLKSAFSSAGFNLRKWCSNVPEFLDMIPESDRETKATNTNIKALGISYSQITDEFSYVFSIKETNPSTKRMLTSEIFSLFDPLGWISPVLMKSRNILQKLWMENVDWDQPIGKNFIDSWTQIKNELHLLRDLKIRRWVNYKPTDVIELHGFCDASVIGYASAIYLKNCTENTVFLLVAKSRVAPIKNNSNDDNVTIPRLELCGAVLLSQLINKTVKSLNVKFENIYCWSDSKIVIGWLNADPKRYKTFIASRITKVHKLVGKINWLHVVSEQNPADCASRGLLPSELIEHQLWWNGPEFLRAQSTFHQNISLVDIPNELLNIRINLVDSKVLPSLLGDKTFEDFDTFEEIQKHVANLVNTRQDDVFSADELAEATQMIIRHVQDSELHVEKSLLIKKMPLPKSSKYISLSPFLDENEIIRVGGRLKNSNLSFAAKHQILLPRKHTLTKLLIRKAHVDCLHGGAKLTESVFRHRFWITNSQKTINAVVHRCVDCFRANPRTMQQKMAHLPAVRVNCVDKPFTNTAVDYTGAVFVKFSNCRGARSQKAYIAIFVCMATKAMHIEVVSDMTATAFVAAFRRLVARRGTIRNLYSDNGTNFVKANKILQDNFDFVNEEEYNNEIYKELSVQNTRWHFSPVGGPHFNGLAEAAVKSVKTHLKRTIADTILTFEELATLLAQIEACVNSRPLCPLSSDPTDVGVLTPAHFLIGEPLICPPEPNHLETKISWLKRWQRIQQMTQYFWKRWSTDYLNTLQVKTKWTDIKESPKVGDFVLIREENLPPSQWNAGKITELHPGDDKLTRVVSVRVGNTVQKRPITKICLFPRDENGQTITTNVAKIAREKATSKKKSRGMNILPVITAMLAICSTISHSAPINENPFCSITKFNHAPGLYFEKTYDMLLSNANWNVMTFFEIRKLRTELKIIGANLEDAQSTCKNAMHEKNQCMNMIEHLQTKFQKMNDVNVMLTSPRRTKRATLDVVGDFFGDVFGILGSKFKDEYTEDISKVTKNEEHLLKLLSNHTSILDSTLNVLKKDESQLRQQNTNFKNLLDQVSNHANIVDQHQTYSDAVLYLSQMLNEFETQQEAILRIMTESNRNVISHTLFPVSQMEKQVDIIKNAVGHRYSVPTGMDIYSIGRVQAYKSDGHFIFKISIPLMDNQEYEIYKIHRIPFNKNDHFTMVQSDFTHLLVSAKRQHYQLATNFNAHECTQYKSTTLICSAPKHWYTHERSCCEWNLFNHLSRDKCKLKEVPIENFVSELGENRFVFSLYDKLDIIIICKEEIAHERLSGEGILQLNPRCSVRSNEFKFDASISFKNQSNIIIPGIKIHSLRLANHNENRFNLESITNINMTEFGGTEVLSAERVLNETRKNLELLTLDKNRNGQHHVHHYVMIYVCLTLILLSIILKLVRVILRIPSLPALAAQNVNQST